MHWICNKNSPSSGLLIGVALIDFLFHLFLEKIVAECVLVLRKLLQMQVRLAVVRLFIATVLYTGSRLQFILTE